ncbi:hypothetical protein [Curtobacterium sp. MCSS17_016]|uniref:hypothetical protein n=1 Tax=Curtobacterium sp. MCSS17_016 TaxID=2175644 RepID=UPI000DA837BA|nr:hypothetical protein [Curtobacterium sp. MCSS17_016]WIE81269.1 hypothetical protein DEJ19_018725 [Curtobacterium sp. MCSS17_016]
MTTLSRVIAARQRLRTLRSGAGAPFTASTDDYRGEQWATLMTASGDRVARDVPAPAAALVKLLTSGTVIDHLDQSLTEHIWAEALRHEDGVDVLR